MCGGDWASCVEGDVEWGEWDCRGTHIDGSAFATRGVTILRSRDGLVADMRLYLEPVEAGGEDIDGSLTVGYKPPPKESG